MHSDFIVPAGSGPRVRTGVAGSPFLGYGDELEHSDGVICERLGKCNVLSEKIKTWAPK